MTEMVALGFLPVVVDIVVHDALTGQAVQQEGEVMILGVHPTWPDDDDGVP